MVGCFRRMQTVGPMIVFLVENSLGWTFVSKLALRMNYSTTLEQMKQQQKTTFPYIKED